MLRKQRISLTIEIFIKLHNKIVWLDGFKQRHLFHGLLNREILRGILRIQMILRTQFKGIGAFCKRKRPVVHRTPSQAYTSTQTNLGVGQPFFDPQKRPFCYNVLWVLML